MATVQFNDVGRDRQSWVTEMTSLTRKSILQQIRRHGAVPEKVNTELLVRWDEQNRNADILAGDRVVGKIHVIRFAL